MDPKQTLILTVGLPRAGKSTWARQSGFPIVNPDAIRLALHGQAFFGPAEPFVWAMARLQVRSLFLAGHPVVVLDATNTTPKRREEWLDHGWEIRFKTFDTPVEVCLERARCGGREDLVPVIQRMAEALSIPDPEDFPWIGA